MFIALVLAAILARSLLAQDEGTPKMREVSDAIRVGAEAFIKRQYLDYRHPGNRALPL